MHRCSPLGSDPIGGMVNTSCWFLPVLAVLLRHYCFSGGAVRDNVRSSIEVVFSLEAAWRVCHLCHILVNTWLSASVHTLALV